MKIKSLLSISLSALMLTCSSAAFAEAGRYQAYWNGKSYMILDSDKGYLWTYFGDTIMYNGRFDGDDFESPEKTRIWQQSHGKWIEKK